MARAEQGCSRLLWKNKTTHPPFRASAVIFLLGRLCSLFKVFSASVFYRCSIRGYPFRAFSMPSIISAGLAPS